jgi:hypothetical protein
MIPGCFNAYPNLLNKSFPPFRGLQPLRQLRGKSMPL